MIVAKFGGTANAPNNVKYLLGCLGRYHDVIVVSAVGKEFDGDEKITDLLYRYYFGDDCAWGRIEEKFKRLCLVNAVDIDVERLLFDAKSRTRKFGADYCLSIGEELTAKCVAALTGREYAEAAEFVRFENSRFRLRETLKRLKNLKKSRVVMGGFYGGTADGGRQTFSRGGGDVSGALCAAACGASLYENVTDVDGVFVSNPRIVDDVQKLDGLSFAEMRLLAQSGANVLHPDAVEICRKYNVPIVVKSFLHGGTGTLVDNYIGRAKVLGVTSKRQSDGTFVTTVLHNFDGTEVAERMVVLCGVCGNAILYVKCVPRVVRIKSCCDILVSVYNAFVG